MFPSSSPGRLLPGLLALGTEILARTNPLPPPALRPDLNTTMKFAEPIWLLAGRRRPSRRSGRSIAASIPASARRSRNSPPATCWPSSPRRSRRAAAGSSAHALRRRARPSCASRWRVPQIGSPLGRGKAARQSTFVFAVDTSKSMLTQGRHARPPDPREAGHHRFREQARWRSRGPDRPSPATAFLQGAADARL